MKYQYGNLSRNGSCWLYWHRLSKSRFLVLLVFVFGLLMLSVEFPMTSNWIFKSPKLFQSIKNSTSFMLQSDNTENTTILNHHIFPVKDEYSDIELKWEIAFLNNQQTVWNLNRFGPITNDTIIIAIQAHKRVVYLQELIKSLQNNTYIDDTLLVFSHGFYSEEINTLVRAIQFTRVLQIWFPYSLQTHPDTFPGFSTNDCPHGLSKEELQKLNCSGKARDVKSLQVKHHWWWKVNTVFDKLRITTDFNGLVFFLEEDHYVFPDLLHTLRLMKAVAPKHCPECNIFGLGQDPRPRSIDDYRGLADKVSVEQWNNMGFAFDRDFWRGLSSSRCSDMFCEYNDYNWDFTLAYLSHKCLPRELKPLTVYSPRVFHIGDCGIHFHSSDCSARKTLGAVRALQQSVSEYLFPATLKVISASYQQRKVDGRNGGWDDPRDINLCKAISR